MHAIFALLAFVAHEPASTAAPATPAAQAAPAKDEKLICVTKAKVGTRFKERTCMDKAEYARRQEEERKAVDRMQRVPRNCASGGGC
jgi:predicted secreted protein